ncbi:MAG: hypothetical protein IPI06_07640 [Gammaproteobacteria bacterium]|nr:hypothetical protein [Gammaproteobacteria bacterium]
MDTVTIAAARDSLWSHLGPMLLLAFVLVTVTVVALRRLRTGRDRRHADARS